MKTFIKYWSYLMVRENSNISFEKYLLLEDRKTYIVKHKDDKDFNQDIFDKYWNDIRNRIKGKPEANIDTHWMNKPFKDLALFVQNFDTRNQSQRKEVSDKQSAINAGAHYLGDMKNAKGVEYEIWIPSTHSSSNILRNKYKGGNGIGKSWCISVSGTTRHWDGYVKDDGANFIFLIKKNLVKSQSEYKIDDKIAIELLLAGDMAIWDMDDNPGTLDINDFDSIISFAKEKAEREELFPNNYKNIIIGGQEVLIANSDTINCYGMELTSLEGCPTELSNSFDCSENNLTSLEGGPQKVGRNFVCSVNSITSLVDAPKVVGGNFECGDNQLTSLVGAPSKVGGEFDCSGNELVSLKGSPKVVGGDFDCSYNYIRSLVGGPSVVNGHFRCTSNKLTSLRGAPRKTKDSFHCSYNQLTSLEGAPQLVGGVFDCSNNKLTSLEGAPQEVGGFFSCEENALTSLVGAPSKVGGGVWCNDNVNLPPHKIEAYKTYLTLSDSEKAPLTKDNHYYPTEEWENKFK